MTDIPRAVVTARRTAGLMLLGSGLMTIVALALLIGWWATRPPTVVPIAGPAGTYPAYSTYPTSSAPSPTYSPPTPVDAGAALRQQSENDRPAVAAIPDGYWVPQLSSKRPGRLPDGVTYTEQSILDDHLTLRSSYSGVALLWSGDYLTFDFSNYWVTILATRYSSSADEANAWCDSAGLDRDHCFAKRISSTTRYETNTKHRR